MRQVRLGVLGHGGIRILRTRTPCGSGTGGVLQGVYEDVKDGRGDGCKRVQCTDAAEGASRLGTMGPSRLHPSTHQRTLRIPRHMCVVLERSRPGVRYVSLDG